ncbi:hypothetical protein BJ742DRAFT_819395 [Cladochytrium replicatum]|nr:hypothetical protein BJ742DRAFT_819395 [Cladochytrium replicatum]
MVPNSPQTHSILDANGNPRPSVSSSHASSNANSMGAASNDPNSLLQNIIAERDSLREQNSHLWKLNERQREKIHILESRIANLERLLNSQDQQLQHLQHLQQQQQNYSESIPNSFQPLPQIPSNASSPSLSLPQPQSSSPSLLDEWSSAFPASNLPNSSARLRRASHSAHLAGSSPLPPVSAPPSLSRRNSASLSRRSSASHLANMFPPMNEEFNQRHRATSADARSPDLFPIHDGPHRPVRPATPPAPKSLSRPNAHTLNEEQQQQNASPTMYNNYDDFGTRRMEQYGHQQQQTQQNQQMMQQNQQYTQRPEGYQQQQLQQQQYQQQLQQQQQQMDAYNNPQRLDQYNQQEAYQQQRPATAPVRLDPIPHSDPNTPVESTPATSTHNDINQQQQQQLPPRRVFGARPAPPPTIATGDKDGQSAGPGERLVSPRTRNVTAPAELGTPQKMESEQNLPNVQPEEPATVPPPTYIDALPAPTPLQQPQQPHPTQLPQIPVSDITFNITQTAFKDNEKSKVSLAIAISIRDAAGRELGTIVKTYADFVAVDGKVRTVSRSSEKVGKLPSVSGNHEQRKAVLEGYLKEMQKHVGHTTDFVEFLNSGAVTTPVATIVTAQKKSAQSDTKEGVLLKRGKNFGGWKPRLYTLKSGYFDYYDVKSKEHGGTIKLKYCSVTPGVVHKDSTDRELRTAFTLTEYKRTVFSDTAVPALVPLDGVGVPQVAEGRIVARHVLSAPSDEERTDWMRCLISQIQNARAVAAAAVSASKSSAAAPTATEKATPTVASTNGKGVENRGKNNPLRALNALSFVSDDGNDLFGEEIVEKGGPGGKKKKKEEAVAAVASPTPSAQVSIPKRRFPANNNANGPPTPTTPTGESAPQLTSVVSPSPPKAGLLGAMSSSPPKSGNTRPVLTMQPPPGQANGVAPPRLRNYVDDNERVMKQKTAVLDGVEGGTGPKEGGGSNATEEKSKTDKKSKRMTAMGGFVGWGKKKPNESSSSSRAVMENGAKRIFGAHLADAIAISRIKEGYELPAVVYRCIEYLEGKKAGDEEGIYRLSGSATLINQLRDRFDTELDVDLLGSGEYHDVHVVAGLLKLYFRELPTPVLTRELQKEFLRVTDLQDRNERVAAIARFVAQLPLANYTLLRAMIGHIIRIVQKSDRNKMTVRNIGIVFSPTLGIPAGVFTLMLAEYEIIFSYGVGPDGERERAAKAAGLKEEKAAELAGVVSPPLPNVPPPVPVKEHDVPTQASTQQDMGADGKTPLWGYTSGSLSRVNGSGADVEEAEGIVTPGRKGRLAGVGDSEAGASRNSLSYMEGAPEMIKSLEATTLAVRFDDDAGDFSESDVGELVSPKPGGRRRNRSNNNEDASSISSEGSSWRRGGYADGDDAGSRFDQYLAERIQGRQGADGASVRSVVEEEDVVMEYGGSDYSAEERDSEDEAGGDDVVVID